MSLFGDELPRAVSIDRQIECVERELKQRAYVYPRRIEAGKMTQEQSDREVACMEAVAATLRALELVRSALRSAQALAANEADQRGDNDRAYEPRAGDVLELVAKALAAIR
ncbi:MAG: hypothetical protein IT547_18170 [Hyphomonadaceae bacterium]|nr:hypothetical protein [Hyphomonadaceae bacterium]